MKNPIPFSATMRTAMNNKNFQFAALAFCLVRLITSSHFRFPDFLFLRLLGSSSNQNLLQFFASQEYLSANAARPVRCFADIARESPILQDNDCQSLIADEHATIQYCIPNW